MTGMTQFLGTWTGPRRVIRATGVLMVAAVVASTLTGIPVVPGMPKPPAAHAASTTGRLCFNTEATGHFNNDSETATFKLFVPSGAAVQVSGVATVLAKNVFNYWQTSFTVSNVGVWTIGPVGYNPPGSPPYSEGFSGGFHNGGADGTYVLTVSQKWGTSLGWRFTPVITNGVAVPAGACTMTQEETLGDNCAAKHATANQVKMADPVNTATGNFHESFTDFVIPGRGPGIALTHAYNSLRAGVDGPLGFGWTHAYAMSASENPTTKVVTVHQEGGAQLTFYPDGAGGYEAPPRAVATLVKNADGSFVLQRCSSTTLGFSASGQLTSIKDRNGYATTLAYSSGRLSSVTDSANRRLSFVWTGTRITSVSDASTPARSVAFVYSAAGDLTEYRDVGGGTWQFTYDAGHRLETMRRPRHAGVTNPPVTRNTYDAANRVLIQTDELQRKTTFDYTSIPGSTKVTDPKLNVTVIAYRNYLPTSITRGWGTADAATWSFEVDRTGGIGTVTDPNNHVVRNTYDTNGNLTLSLDALNRLTRATYNGFDQPITVTDPAGVTTTYTYDPSGNLKTVATPLVGTAQVRQVSLAYDPARPGDVVSVTDPKNKVWNRAYDGFGNLISETDPLGNKTLYGYDTAKGWLSSAVSPRGVAAGVTTACTPPALGCANFSHDAWGQVTVATDANNNRSTRHFDLNGNVDYEIDAEGKRTEFVYDAADQNITVKRADGTELRTTYWPDGSVKETIDAKQAVTSFTYDAQGRLASTTDPANRKTTYGYDKAGNLTSKADAGGSCPGSACTTMGYDVADQLTSVTYGSGTTPNVTNITYDNAGRRTGMTDGSGTSTWAWDSLGRLTSAKDGAGKVIGYLYANTRDPATTITYPGNKVVTRGFDDAGRMTTVGDWLSNTTTYTPDADSNITKATFPAGTGLVDTYAFDNADRLMNITEKLGTATVVGFDYGRDKIGQLKSVTTTGGLNDTHTYAYTSLNELEKVDAATYAYDDADNITGLAPGGTADYDPANQLKTLTRATNLLSYTFDAKGNRTAANPRVGTGMKYSYDQANRMVNADPTTYNTSVSVGWYHSLAARSDGTVWAWGYNSHGQLGNNTTTDSAVPVQVPGLTGVVAVAGAAYQSIALKSDGTVWAWGWNGVGQLGNNSTVDSRVPVQVHGLSDITAIAAGASHLLALRRDGTVYAWGYNSNGQIGNGTTTDALVPVIVAGLTDVTAIAGGYTSSHALKADGTVWGWGYNAYRQLANGSTADSTVAVQAQGISGVAALSAGYFHVLVAKGDGTVWGWGFNGVGQLGNNTTTDPTSPVQAIGLSGVREVVASTYQSMAVKADGAVATWGWNAYGQLANGTTTNASVPQVVPALAGVKGLAAGPNNGLALKADGSALGWGWNGVGTVGDATTTDRPSPVGVSGYNRGSTPRATYAYDGSGLRTKKTVAGAMTSFTWELSSGLPLLIDDGTNYYIYGPDGLPLSHIDRSNNVTWYHHDQIGTTRVLSNNSGAAFAAANYDPYGRLVLSVGKLSPLGFAGEYTDAETGFVYLRARYYDPATAQFTTRDPLEAVSGDPYGYAAGNPLNLIDPTGELPVVVAGMVIGGLIGGLGDVAVQLAFQAASGCGVSLSKVNKTQVAMAVAFGAASQGLGSRPLGVLANRGAASMNPGRGPVYGTRVHAKFAELIRTMGRKDIHSEISYLRGKVVPYGTRGSVRLDAVVGTPNAPVAIYDLKTGSAALTSERIAQIRSHLPPRFQNVRISVLRPR